jgi:hypothetical protein
MGEPWFILTSRYGGDTRDPSLDELRFALDEVYVENHPGMTLTDYEEHPSAFVRYGVDAGPMYLLYVGRSGAVTLEQWVDQDYGDELAKPLTMEKVSREEALAMWSKLQSGQIEALRSDFKRQGR